MSRHFTVALERSRFRVGEVVRGRIDVHTAARSRGLEGELVLREETEDFRHVAYSARTGKLNEGDLQPGMQLSFWLQIPAAGPPSLTTEVGRLAWLVVVRSDERGRDEVFERPIVVAP